MLSKGYFYHKTIKRIITLVGAIFSEIEIEKTPDNPEESPERIIVPIQYGITSTYFIKNEYTNPEPIIRKFSLPRIFYNLESIAYDASKKSTSQQRFYNNFILNDDNTYSYQYSPNPYKFNFSVSIYTQYKNDLYQIVEQICPYFCPTLFFNVNMIPEMEEFRDIAVTLTNLNFETNFDSGFETVTLNSANFNLEVDGFLYSPINREKYIKSVLTRMSINNLDKESYLTFR